MGAKQSKLSEIQAQNDQLNKDKKSLLKQLNDQSKIINDKDRKYKMLKHIKDLKIDALETQQTNKNLIIQKLQYQIVQNQKNVSENSRKELDLSHLEADLAVAKKELESLKSNAVLKNTPTFRRICSVSSTDKMSPVKTFKYNRPAPPLPLKEPIVILKSRPRSSSNQSSSSNSSISIKPVKKTKPRTTPKKAPPPIPTNKNYNYQKYNQQKDIIPDLRRILLSQNRISYKNRKFGYTIQEIEKCYNEFNIDICGTKDNLRSDMNCGTEDEIVMVFRDESSGFSSAVEEFENENGEMRWRVVQRLKSEYTRRMEDMQSLVEKQGRNRKMKG